MNGSNEVLRDATESEASHTESRAIFDIFGGLEGEQGTYFESAGVEFGGEGSTGEKL